MVSLLAAISVLSNFRFKLPLKLFSCPAALSLFGALRPVKTQQKQEAVPREPKFELWVSGCDSHLSGELLVGRPHALNLRLHDVDLGPNSMGV